MKDHIFRCLLNKIRIVRKCTQDASAVPESYFHEVEIGVRHRDKSLKKFVCSCQIDSYRSTRFSKIVELTLDQSRVVSIIAAGGSLT